MEFLEARRMTGPNVLWNKSGAILDISCSAEETDRLIPFCEDRIRGMLDVVGWEDESICHLRLLGGLSIAFSAPIDALYAASAINEWVWACCEAEFDDGEVADFEGKLTEIKAAIAEEINPPLLALQSAALDHDVAFLWDDDEVSVGHGSHSETWPLRELPDPDDLDWSRYHDVPAGIVTGTGLLSSALAVGVPPLPCNSSSSCSNSSSDIPLISVLAAAVTTGAVIFSATTGASTTTAGTD